ncbi:hypothetical protein KUH32_05595 [Thalassococcus sp. CAU 1522]|uniref:Uncharacterized protein n=2 Tax=Thalassococcus arenae TaxID=2851652 RepID=A0ABS6N6U6_9RHOB|nr:hypothetical protein [Thalassococcus arenae]
MIGAAARAFLVAMLIAMPAVLLPGISADSAQIAALLSLIAAVLTFVEYHSDSPSLLEFRAAPPFNRLRFVALFLTVLALTLIARGAVQPSLASEILTGMGARIGSAMDVPFSPVHLVILMVPADTSETIVQMVRIHAGTAYLMSMLTLLLFILCVRLMAWPIRNGAFNFYVNLPLFDPTTGGDVLARLKRDGNVNVALGFLLPFLIPAVVQTFAAHTTPPALENPQTLIWMLSAWAFLPVSLIMRGVALLRIAGLVEEKRRRAYAQPEAQII